MFVNVGASGPPVPGSQGLPTYQGTGTILPSWMSVLCTWETDLRSHNLGMTSAWRYAREHSCWNTSRKQLHSSLGHTCGNDLIQTQKQSYQKRKKMKKSEMPLKHKWHTAYKCFVFFNVLQPKLFILTHGRFLLNNCTVTTILNTYKHSVFVHRPTFKSYSRSGWSPI